MKFANDKAMLTFALQTLQTSNDADDLICSNENTLNRKDLKHTSDVEQLSNLIQDVQAFCCAFSETK